MRKALMVSGCFLAIQLYTRRKDSWWSPERERVWEMCVWNEEMCVPSGKSRGWVNDFLKVLRRPGPSAHIVVVGAQVGEDVFSIKRKRWCIVVVEYTSTMLMRLKTSPSTLFTGSTAEITQILTCRPRRCRRRRRSIGKGQIRKNAGFQLARS